MITLFVLESVNDDFYPSVYAIPLEKQLEVENIAKRISKNPLYSRRPYKAFEDELRENEIEYEWIGWIAIRSYDERQVDWIDDKIPRELV